MRANLVVRVSLILLSLAFYNPNPEVHLVGYPKHLFSSDLSG